MKSVMPPYNLGKQWITWVSTTSKATSLLPVKWSCRICMSNLSKVCYRQPKGQVMTHTLTSCWIEVPLLVMNFLFHMELLCVKSDLTFPKLLANRMQVKQSTAKQPVTRPQSDIIRATSKNQPHATANLLPIGVHVMYKTPPFRLSYPAIITNILKDSWSYIITTPDVTTYRCVRFQLKHYKPNKLPRSQETHTGVCSILCH